MFSSLFFNRNLLDTAKDLSQKSICLLKKELNHTFVNVDIKDDNKPNYTPLMWAVHNGQREKIDLLLDKKANAYLTTSDKSTLLHIAASKGHIDIYLYLAHHFPDLCKMRNDEGLLPEKLLEQRINLDATNSVHDRFLSEIKKSPQVTEPMKQLINANCLNIDARDIFEYNGSKPVYYAYTALMWAVYLGHLEQVKFLLKHHANPDLTTENGDTILHIAAKQGHVNVYQYLAHNCSHLLYKCGNKNRTPEDVAEIYNQTSLVKINREFFSNSFFTSAKLAIPKELVAYIVSFIHHPEDMQNASSVNHSWHALLKETHFLDSFKNYIRSQLPPELKDMSWELVTRHFFQLDKNNNSYSEKQDEWYWLKKFIKLATTYYIIGENVALGSKKSHDVYCDYRGYGYYPNQPRKKNYFEKMNVSVYTIKRNYIKLLSENTSITIYDSVYSALQEEYKINADLYYDSDEYYQRSPTLIHHRMSASPIYEIRIDLELGIRLLQEKGMAVKPESIISVKNYYLADTDRHIRFKDDACFVRPNKITIKKEDMVHLSFTVKQDKVISAELKPSLKKV